MRRLCLIRLGISIAVVAVQYPYRLRHLCCAAVLKQPCGLLWWRSGGNLVLGKGTSMNEQNVLLPSLRLFSGASRLLQPFPTFRMRASYESYRSQEIWNVHPMLLLLLFGHFLCVSATVVCTGCRPLDLQEGPGVGLSLSPDHGSASVRFTNGSILDTGIIYGTIEYVTAMKYLTGSAALGALDSFRDSKLNLLENPSAGSWKSILGSYLPTYFCSPSPVSTNPSEPALEPIVEMMRSLYQQTSAIVPLKYKKVLVAFPDFVVTTNSALHQIGPLAQRAGLEGFRGRSLFQTQSGLVDFYGLESCYGITINMTHGMPDLECEKYNGRPIQTILSVQLDSNFFGLRLTARNDGMLGTDANMTETHFDRGITSPQYAENPEEYWDWIGRGIRNFSHHEGSPVDLLLLHGTQTTRPELLDVLQAVFAENDKIKPQDYLRSPTAHTYAAARGAAQIAKRGMWDDFDACMPDRACPISEHMPSHLRWQIADEKVEVKQEL